jgi:hypothetical protein
MVVAVDPGSRSSVCGEHHRTKAMKADLLAGHRLWRRLVWALPVISETMPRLTPDEDKPCSIRQPAEFFIEDRNEIFRRLWQERLRTVRR